MILGAGRFALTARILKVFWSSCVKLTRSVAKLSQFIYNLKVKVKSNVGPNSDWQSYAWLVGSGIMPSSMGGRVFLSIGFTTHLRCENPWCQFTTSSGNWFDNTCRRQGSCWNHSLFRVFGVMITSSALTATAGQALCKGAGTVTREGQGPPPYPAYMCMY